MDRRGGDVSVLEPDRRRARPGGLARVLIGFATITGSIIMTSCADTGRSEASTPAPRPGNFPVVEPFALDQAGSSVSVTFELPDARDNGVLRPVFVGFQAVDRKGSGPDEEMLAAQTVRDYLRNEAIPVRVRLWRIEGTEWRPVVLSDGHWDMKDKRASWGLHPDDVFRHHFSASTDNGPLIASGHYDFGKVYYVHAFARIVPPTPGRYHLEVENLDAHSVLLAQKEHLSVLRYELLVSHYHHRGID